MKKADALLLLGSVLAAWGAIALAACGSEVEAQSAGPDGAVDEVSPDGSTPDAGAAASCGRTPTLKPVVSGKGVHCPFSAPDGSPWLDCSPGQHCCQPLVETDGLSTCRSSCTTGNGAPFEGSDWECGDPVHCAGATGSPVCCGIGQVGIDPSCTYLRASQFRGTTCRPKCGSTEFVVCQNDSQCPFGTKCTPLKARGGQIGACL